MGKWRSSAAYRIAFTYSAAVALAILLLGAAVYFAANAEFRRQRDNAIVEEARSLARETDLGELVSEINARERPEVHDALRYALFDRARRRIAGTLDAPRPSPGMATIVFNDGDDPHDIARADTVRLTDGHTLTVALDTERIEEIDATILILFGAAFVLLLIGAAGGALLLGTYLRRRLATIGDTAQAIVAGDLSRRVAIGAARDEFDQAGAAINAMLDRIVQLMENLRQVSSDVAHDLRTPLVRLRNQLELVGTVEGAAERAIAQGDTLLALFAAILRIAEVEGGTLAAGFAPVDLSALAADTCDGYHPAIADSGRSLECDIAPGTLVLGNRELLAQSIGNLLDNARVHTPAGTAIRLTLTSDGRVARLSVADEGPGIAAQDRRRILQRFVRGEASRTTPGAGLGLSLVAAVAAAHGGEVAVFDNAPGLRISITLPRIAE
jgi:signal transduction histidine kinase